MAHYIHPEVTHLIRVLEHCKLVCFTDSHQKRPYLSTPTHGETPSPGSASAHWSDTARLCVLSHFGLSHQVTPGPGASTRPSSPSPGQSLQTSSASASFVVPKAHGLPPSTSSRSLVAGVAVQELPLTQQRNQTGLLPSPACPGRLVLGCSWKMWLFAAAFKALQILVAAKFIWHRLTKVVRDWAATCVVYQQAKVHLHIKAPLADFPVPERRFDHVHMDLAGLLPTPRASLTSSQWLTGPRISWNPSRCHQPHPTRRLVHCDVSCRFGTPSDLSLDRGSQFTSELWNVVAESLGVTVHHTTAYHPQANGLCERFHRSTKAALRASLKDSSWVHRLLWVMLGLWTAPKEDLRFSSAELVYGQPLRLPGILSPTLRLPGLLTDQVLTSLSYLLAYQLFFAETLGVKIGD